MKITLGSPSGYILITTTQRFRYLVRKSCRHPRANRHDIPLKSPFVQAVSQSPTFQAVRPRPCTSGRVTSTSLSIPSANDRASSDPSIRHLPKQRPKTGRFRPGDSYNLQQSSRRPLQAGRF